MPLPPELAVREAARNARAHRGTTTVVTIVTVAMTAIAFLTAGRAAAAEADVLRTVDEAGPRLITLTVAEPSPGLGQSALARLRSLDDLEWVVGLGGARDVRSQATGRSVNVAARDLLTELPAEVTVEIGRLPLPNEAIVGAEPQKRLRMLEPSGTLLDDGVQRSVVGRFGSSGVIADLDRLVLVQPDDSESGHATLIYALVRDADQVHSAVEQIRSLAGIDPDTLNVQTSSELVELERVLSGQVGAFGRQLALGAIAAGIMLVSLTMTLALMNRRRDFGRRRALGASRSALLALTIMESAIPILTGLVLGAIVGLSTVHLWIGTLPPPTFIAATIALIATTGIGAALPPAALAAWQDPVKILRVP